MIVLVPYDLDRMMDLLVQGHGDSVYQQTRSQAAAGLVEAQLMMGILHQIGVAVPINGSEAERFYRLAAEGGNAVAWRNLGTLYLLGLAGVKIDKAKAHHCFTEARLLETSAAARNLQTTQTIH